MRRCSGAEAGISAELSTFGPLKPLKFHMPRTITLTLSPKQAADRKVYTEIAARRAGVPPADVALVRILKRSVDARGRSVRVNLTLELYADGDGPAPEVRFDYPDVSHAEEVVIVGGGPAGLFCALRLIESGYRPVILERGREVSVRRRDVAELNRNGRLDPDSNYAFGEGGAGTFSDGKLNTQTHGGFNREVLETFVRFGAPEEILWLNKPHIGTDLLREVIKNIRKEILRLGGDVRFEAQVTDFEIQKGQLRALIINGAERLECEAGVLAIGHSARDTFALLKKRQFSMSPKAFAVGVRMEHPQHLIDQSQYGKERGTLPAADYKLTCQLPNGRGVYSFCMCPGGYVVNASSEEGKLAVNGMSYHSRNGDNANSAIVVTVTPEDFPGDDVLAGVEFQRKLEAAAYEAGDGKIPVQLYHDFCKKQVSESLGETTPSMKGAWTFGNVRDCFPKEIGDSIEQSIKVFGRKIRGFDRGDAILSAVESRTSSPVRIEREKETLESSISGIYPCGEGAGYAGGITSAAADGIKIAEKIRQKYAPFL